MAKSARSKKTGRYISKMRKLSQSVSKRNQKIHSSNGSAKTAKKNA